VSMGHFITHNRAPDGLGGEGPFLGTSDPASQKPVLGLRLHVPNPPSVFLGNDERVPRGTGPDVQESEELVVLVDYFRRPSSGDNLAEYATVHQERPFVYAA